MTQKIRTELIDCNDGQVAGLPRNPRKISDKMFERLKRSLTQSPEMLGLRPLIVFPHAGRYVAIGGNMRLLAVKDMGWEEVPCNVLSPDTPSEKLAEYTIKDNNAYGEDDMDILAEEWTDFPMDDFDKDFGGFEDIEEKAPESDSTPTTVEEDDFDENTDAVEARCKEGDLWLLGRHRLLCGDSTKEDDIKLVCDGDVEMILTDPPYGIDYVGKTKDALKIQNDNLNDIEFHEFLSSAFGAAKSSLRRGGAFYIWHADNKSEIFRRAAQENEMLVKQVLIWNKNTFTFGRQDYHWKHEPCLYGWREGAAHTFYGGHNQSTVWDFNRPNRNGEHPTMKPVELFARCITNSTKVNDKVLDMFLGSGTSIIAAEQTGRICVGLEKDPHYCDVIIARYEKLTGVVATKIN